jgi:hypothetical protein
VPVQGQEDQQRQQSRQLRHDRQLAGILRVVEDREERPICRPISSPAMSMAGEDHAQGEAQGIMPIRPCWSQTASPAQEPGATCGSGGRIGARPA